MFHHFLPGSANADNFPKLLLQQADEFIDQLNNLLLFLKIQMPIRDIFSFRTKKNDGTLATLFNNYKSDKSATHHYDIIYDYIFNDLGRYNKLDILEIGLGTNNPEIISTMGMKGVPGASLRAFRDYLPNSSFVGADIDRDILFNERNIQTYFVDQMNYSTFNSVSHQTYDLIIDDGLHTIGANLNTLRFGLEHVKEGGWIVIEDIARHQLKNWCSVDYILRQNYSTYMVKDNDCYVYVLKNQKKIF